MIATLLVGCMAPFPIEPARVWTGSSKYAGFGGSLDVVDGTANVPTVLASQDCEADAEVPPASDCSGKGGVMALSFDTPSGVAADVAAARFPEEEDWWFSVRWLGDIVGDGGVELGVRRDDAILAFDPEALSSVPDDNEGTTIVTANIDFSWSTACGDVNGDGHDDLCVRQNSASEDGLAVLYGPFDQPRDNPVFLQDADWEPFLPGDLDSDGDDEFLLDTISDGLVAWSPDAGDFVSTDEGAVLRQCQGATGGFYGGFTAGDSDGDGVPDLFDGAHLLHGPSVLDPAAADCEALVLTTFDPEGRTVDGGATGDLDGDGVSDLAILVADADGTGELQLYRGPIPPGSFDAGHAEAVLPWLGSAIGVGELYIELADLDGDGRDELVVTMDAPRGSPPGMRAVYVWKGGDLLPPR